MGKAPTWETKQKEYSNKGPNVLDQLYFFCVFSIPLPTIRQ